MKRNQPEPNSSNPKYKKLKVKINPTKNTPQPSQQASSAVLEDSAFCNKMDEQFSILEDHLISHIDEKFDNLSQLVARQQSSPNVPTQDEVEIAEEPSIYEPNLKSNDYPPGFVRQLFNNVLLSESYPPAHVDAAFNVLDEKCHRVLQSFEESLKCKPIDFPTWSNISHFQRDKLCKIVVNAANESKRRCCIVIKIH